MVLKLQPSNPAESYSTLADQPIGIFDSGIGGLTIAHAIIERLPKENIIYFGDTAHMPYGDKSVDSLQAYTLKIVELFLQKSCKLIVIACHSASAVAYDVIKNYVLDRTIVINVIDPMAHLIQEKYHQQYIGLIGTRRTVESGIYPRKINSYKKNIRLSTYATNLLASTIEEFGSHNIIDELLKIYLAHPRLQGIDVLVLACTHYPIIRQKIIDYYNRPVIVLDSAEIVAQAVHQQLCAQGLLRQSSHHERRFYISDYTESFVENAKLFFKEEIHLEHYPLWHG